MQHYQRRKLLSAALQLPPGREPTRETVEAAIWQALGPLADESRVSLLLSVIDAYSDSRSRRAAATWARQTDGVMPPLGTDIAQSIAVRRALDGLSQLPRATTTRVPQAAPPTMISPSPAGHLSLVSDGTHGTSSATPAITDDIWNEISAEFGMANSPRHADPAPSASLSPPVPSSPRDASHGDNEVGEELFSCNSCPISKPRSEFYKSASNKRGFDYICKRCKNQKNKDWRDRKKREQEEMARQPADAIGKDENTSQNQNAAGYLLSG